MSRLRLFAETQPEQPVLITDHAAEISAVLARAGVRFERWHTASEITVGADHTAVIDAYRPAIDRLLSAEGYQTFDVVSMYPAHPDKTTMRQKFLDEHIHSEDEVRFFVAGRGLFTLHIDTQIYEILCEQGDLISVPANTRHWFDMGAEPTFVAIRFFNNPEGWIARFTGNDIAKHFPRLD
jgi:1,2-dihydroxy-3-keto-5-methylthiopentene dioxygenase